jgi:tRNA pseudouridine55 synthase
MTPPTGFVIIDKPSGATSFSMVSLVRRLTGVRRVGHAGTLDPLASGVLPVAFGQATRLIEYLDDATKSYMATIRFGVETNTYDAEGAVTATYTTSGLTEEAVTHVLGEFEGEFSQVPPVFSAIKLKGRPLYRYAREGVVVAVEPRRVRVHSIKLIGFECGPRPSVTLDIVCSKGTYIRSIAHDLGRALGVGGHLSSLRRTSSGGFSLADAAAPEELVGLHAAGRLEEAVLAADRAVERREAAILATDRAADVVAGRAVLLELRRTFASGPAPEICRAYDESGRFIGVLVPTDDGRWRPAKVLAGAVIGPQSARIWPDSAI